MIKYYQRLKKLEQRLASRRQLWAVFAIRFYDDPEERAKAQRLLVDDFIKAGNPTPTHRVFINELPFPEKKSQEGFLHSFVI